MMKIREYLQRKYGRETSLGLLACEARALNIPYPLLGGWLNEFGDRVIFVEQRAKLLAALRKSKSEHAPAAIAVLEEPEASAADQVAAAAQVMLAALQAILPFIPKTSASEGGAAKYSASVDAADQVRAAIALATGVTS